MSAIAANIDEEAAWWERFWQVADRQWEMTDALNLIVRADYLTEMHTHLYVKEGRLLDVGCGSGWLGLAIAGDEMDLVGIDTSPSQVEAARLCATRLGRKNAHFLVGTIGDLPEDQRFDSTLIHAVLHHLPRGDIVRVINGIADHLVEGGRLYLYEPIARERPSLCSWIASAGIFTVVWSPFWILHEMAVHLKFGPHLFRKAAKNGWNGLSPTERPLDRTFLFEHLHTRFTFEAVRYRHAYSLAFAMGCSELSPPFAHLAAMGARGLYWLDQRLLAGPLTTHLYGVWTFASIAALACSTISSAKNDGNSIVCN